jgi:putative addiction module CopG family antidote
MNLSLTPEPEQFVQAKVESGRYNSASEVVRKALRLLEDHEQAQANSLRSGSINFVRRGSRRTVMKKYRGKGRRNLDTALHYNRL